MMNNGANSCYPNGATYAIPDQEGLVISNSSMETASNSSHPSSFLYNLSVLKDKVHQVQSLATIFMSPHESTAIVIPTMGTVIQEIIVTASSMMFACQQMCLGSSPTMFSEVEHGYRPGKAPEVATTSRVAEERVPTGFFSDHTTFDPWYGDGSYDDDNENNNNNNSFMQPHKKETDIHPQLSEGGVWSSTASGGKKHDIIELAAADLLAKYTHYCHVCGKGFKRDANLRMHMRAHGDEYKSSAALSNPAKNTAVENAASGAADGSRPKYSCPQEGCRWNKNHAKFQPLKSMICVKNHYKRSHCPKMYVCKRCNRKQFSVLSDLRTHEKHCGDLKWQCSCGTTFSRKDKLMGHVALFVGHMPAANSATKMGHAAGPS